MSEILPRFLSIDEESTMESRGDGRVARVLVVSRAFGNLKLFYQFVNEK